MHEEILNEAKRDSVSSPSKVRKKVRTEVRSANRGADKKKKDAIRKQEDRREEKKTAKFAVVLQGCSFLHGFCVASLDMFDA
jgi:hypothetical protein